MFGPLAPLGRVCRARNPTCSNEVALQLDVHEWITNWNQEPNPFVRTKTADDSLQSLSKYIGKIFDAH